MFQFLYWYTKTQNRRHIMATSAECKEQEEEFKRESLYRAVPRVMSAMHACRTCWIKTVKPYTKGVKGVNKALGVQKMR